nr:MAG TPA: hypothetical protein [Caudoviricetes sp.]
MSIAIYCLLFKFVFYCFWALSLELEISRRDGCGMRLDRRSSTSGETSRGGVALTCLIASANIGKRLLTTLVSSLQFVCGDSILTHAKVHIGTRNLPGANSRTGGLNTLGTKADVRRIYLVLEDDDSGLDVTPNLAKVRRGRRDVLILEELTTALAGDREVHRNKVTTVIEDEATNLKIGRTITALTLDRRLGKHVTLEGGGKIANRLANVKGMDKGATNSLVAGHFTLARNPVIYLDVAIDANTASLGANSLKGLHLAVDDTLKILIGGVGVAILIGGSHTGEVYRNHIEGLVISGDIERAANVLDALLGDSLL